MAAVGVLFVLVALVLSAGFGVVLYSLVRSEHDQRTRTDRQTAEQLARRDEPDGEASNDARGNHWD